MLHCTALKKLHQLVSLLVLPNLLPCRAYLHLELLYQVVHVTACSAVTKALETLMFGKNLRLTTIVRQPRCAKSDSSLVGFDSIDEFRYFRR